MIQQNPHFKIAMPPDVRNWLDVAAKQAQRSRSAHIVFLLRQEMEKEAPGEELAGNPQTPRQP